MNPLKRYVVWLSRMSHSRGFGVQSPSAYRFIRYVLCEHYPYYAYGELRRTHPSLPWLTRKRMELYFRLANFRQADTWIDNGDDTTLLNEYVAKGCRKTRVANGCSKADIANGCANSTVQIARVCMTDGCEEYLGQLLANTDQNSVIVIEDIASNPVARRMWQQLVRNKAVSVSYDLYYLGVAFFDTERFKTNYIVNF